MASYNMAYSYNEPVRMNVEPVMVVGMLGFMLELSLAITAFAAGESIFLPYFSSYDMILGANYVCLALLYALVIAAHFMKNPALFQPYPIIMAIFLVLGTIAYYAGFILTLVWLGDVLSYYPLGYGRSKLIVRVVVFTIGAVLNIVFYCFIYRAYKKLTEELALEHCVPPVGTLPSAGLRSFAPASRHANKEEM